MKPLGSTGTTRRVGRLTRWLMLLAALWLAASSTAMAQGNKKDEGGPTKSYVLSYFIVMVGVGIGLAAVLRVSKRLEKPPQKHVDDDDDEE